MKSCEQCGGLKPTKRYEIIAGTPCSCLSIRAVKKHRPQGGWDNEHWIYNCSDGPHPSFWKTVVESKQWLEWEREAYKRWDVGESRECDWISQKHFQEFLRFVREKPEL